MKTKRNEAQLLAYRLLYDKSGNLVTERTKVDITKLKKHLAPQDYENLRIIIREATVKLDAIHSYIESYLNARVQNSD
jgi:hypothetical protein|tara:strand:+ start:534 stop:767 length:234 start_codon:yes stop_codon:yes gene_type:complete